MMSSRSKLPATWPIARCEWKLRAVEAGDAGGFLAAMLQRVEAERDEARGVVGAPDAENAALLVQLVVVERIGGQHCPRPALLGASYRCRVGAFVAPSPEPKLEMPHGELTFT